MGRKVVPEKAPAASTCSRLTAMGPQWKFATGGRMFLALLIALCLRVAEWIRWTVLPEVHRQGARAAVVLARHYGTVVDQVRLNGPRASAWGQRTLAMLGVWIQIAVVASARAIRSAVEWTRWIAIPALRNSEAIRYMRRAETAFYGGTIVFAVAVGWLISGL